MFLDLTRASAPTPHRITVLLRVPGGATETKRITVPSFEDAVATARGFVSAGRVLGRPLVEEVRAR